MSQQSPFGPEAVPPTRSRSNVAIVLVVVGLAILLARINVLGAIVWSALLPIGMIAFGIDLLSEGRHRRRIMTGALLAALVCAPLIGVGRAIERSDDTPRVAVPGGNNNLGSLDGVELVEAQVALTAGNLSLRALPERSDAIIATNAGDDREQSVRREGSTAVVKLDQPISKGDLDLRMTRGAPLDLSIVVGAGNVGSLDFEDLQLRTLDLQQTAGDAEISLPEEGVMDVTISSEFGNVVVDIPDDLAARVEVTQRVGDIDVDDRFTQQDGAYVSEAYSDSAPNRATIRITKTAGNITIR